MRAVSLERRLTALERAAGTGASAVEIQTQLGWLATRVQELSAASKKPGGLNRLWLPTGDPGIPDEESDRLRAACREIFDRAPDSAFSRGRDMEEAPEDEVIAEDEAAPPGGRRRRNPTYAE